MSAVDAMAARAPVRLALIGGAEGSFIGPVHRMAAELDGRIELVAGIFSRDPERSRRASERYGIAPERHYRDMQALIAGEQGRPDKVELIAIATPNSSHFAIASAALKAGFDVMSDKPAAASLQEARALRQIVRESGRRYGVTYTYCGYPMVQEARALVESGRLGAIRRVVAEYSQGWLSRPIEREGNAQAAWRTDPAAAGAGGCIADIGVHALHLAELVTGCPVEQVYADLAAVVPGRVLDDDCEVLLRFAGGARGALLASQIAAGDRNGLSLRVWGENGGLQWLQEEPDRLLVNWLDAPSQVLHASSPYLSEAARRASRLPSGHPEGVIESLANLYLNYAAMIRAGEPLNPRIVPGIDAGVRGVEFVDRAVESSRQGGWVRLEKPQETTV